MFKSLPVGTNDPGHLVKGDKGTKKRLSREVELLRHNVTGHGIICRFATLKHAAETVEAVIPRRSFL